MPRRDERRGATAVRRQARPAGHVFFRQPDLIPCGYDEANLPCARLEAARRPECGHLDLELADLLLGAPALAPERVEPVRQMDLFDSYPGDSEGAGREQRRGGEGHDERAAHTSVGFAVKSLVLRHGSRSSTRSFALLARGFSRTSSSAGCRGDGSSSANPADARARNVCFTMRSSPE